MPRCAKCPSYTFLVAFGIEKSKMFFFQEYGVARVRGKEMTKHVFSSGNRTSDPLPLSRSQVVPSFFFFPFFLFSLSNFHTGERGKAIIAGRE